MESASVVDSIDLHATWVEFKETVFITHQQMLLTATHRLSIVIHLSDINVMQQMKKGNTRVKDLPRNVH